ncbi:MAG: DNA mismatch repair protein MutT [Patescibacteria group bacterium]|nr:MAG: DNA mismatch repair protein MutT [Patescibacteria group bacterium]
MSIKNVVNSYRFCPLCGKTNLLRQDDFMLKCKDCRFIYFDNPKPGVSCLIFNHNKQLLFTKRLKEPMKGSLGLPGGFVDSNETLDEAIIREIKEELFLDLNQSDIYYYGSSKGHFEYQGISYFIVTAWFICRKTVDEQTIKFATDEIEDLVFLDPEKIDFDLIKLPDVKNLMVKFINKKDYKKINFKI